MAKKTQTDRYAARGVSAGKEEVHAAVDKLDQGVFKGAFCKITEDYLTGSKKKCNVIHSDGSGTKSIIAYLYFKETGDASVFRGISQDSIVMNIDDLLCIGAVERILLSNTVNRNAKNFTGDALAQLILGSEDFLAKLRKLGVKIYSGGGETADVGDLTGAVVVDSCAVAVMERKNVITGANIKPNLAIVGLSSAGKAKYEDCENSGIGSNGLTSARHDILSPYYRKKYPETYDSNTDKKLVYCGPYKFEDKLEGSNMTIAQALLSPTRTYAPVIMKLIKKYPKLIKGLVHCSGGGQTKCVRFGKGVHFVKDNLMPIPPIFKAIQKASKTTDKEMFEVYNMGHRMEVYCNMDDAKKVIAVAKSFGIDAAVVGRTEKSKREDGKNHVTIVHEGKTIEYGPRD
ncbi:MAG: phosphoribosylformylglycinamidine cyclo-ligase [Verrucomicrobiaceae bacterium]|nr:phosphoribosylformylglycinamidine cyclo-ligase [Verrucomicrobiaceae bacterium]